MLISQFIRQAAGVFALAFSAYLSTAAHAALVRTVNPAGLLTGATGVLIGTATYTVEFIDGTCDAVFGGGCGGFTFTSREAATLASSSLDLLVFGGPGGEAFDNDPTRTRGCEGGRCFLLTPFTRSGDSVFSAMFRNYEPGLVVGDAVIAEGTVVAHDSNLSAVGNMVWAKWTLDTPNSAVPEPTTLALFGVALAALGLRQRKTLQSR